MPQVVVEPTKKKKGLVTSIVVLVLVVLATAGGSYAYWLFVPSVASQVTKAENLDTAGNFSKALSVLQAVSPRAIFKSDKTSVYLGLGTTEYDLGNYPQSVSDYQMADSLQPGQEATLSELAQSAQMAGDNAVELSADKQLLPIFQAHDIGPTRDNDIQLLKDQIAGLEK